MAANSPDRPKSNKHSPGLSELVMALERLGFGELTEPGTQEWIVRVVLFQSMQRLCRKHLRELRESCVPTVQALIESGKRQFGRAAGEFPAVAIELKIDQQTTRQELLWIDSLKALRIAADHIMEVRQLQTILENWASRCHVSEDWFLDAIVRILTVWSVSPEAADDLEWRYPGSLSSAPEWRFGDGDPALYELITALAEVEPPPSIPVYNPAMQTQKEHRASVEASLNKYYEQQEARFKLRGFIPSTRKRRRTAPAWVHMDWFVKYQINERTAAQIARGIDNRELGENAINKAVRDIAKLLQVPLRQQLPAVNKKLKGKSLSARSPRRKGLDSDSKRM